MPEPQYHTTGARKGSWNLDVPEYLGDIDVRGKKILDIGAATGVVSAWCACKDAAVTGLDVPDSPHRQAYTRLLGPRAKHVEGWANELPFDYNQFDVAILGAILMHLEDPFGAVMEAARVAKETVVITAGAPRLRWLGWRLGVRDRDGGLVPYYAPGTYWRVPPRWSQLALREVGLTPRLTWHQQKAFGKWRSMYTCVGTSE